MDMHSRNEYLKVSKILRIEGEVLKGQYQEGEIPDT